MKKYTFLLTFILILSSLIGGCAKNPDQVEHKRTLRVGMICKDQRLTRLFQIKYPEIKVEIVSALNEFEIAETSQKERQEKFLKMFEREKNLDAIVAPDYIYQDLIQANQLKPLEGYTQGSTFKLDQLAPVIVEGLKQKGSGVVYGIPMVYATPMIVYNKTLFSKQGISVPKKELSWDEIFSLAKKLKNTAEKNPNYGLLIQGSALELAEMYNESSQIYSINAKSNRLNVDTPEWKEAWSKTVELIENKAIASPLFRIPTDDNPNISYVGQILKNTGIMFLEYGFKDIIKDLQNPNIPAEQKVDWELAPFPVRDAKHNYSTRIILENMVCIPNNSRNIGDAWKFIEFLSSENVEKTRVTLKALPITKQGIKYFEKKTGINVSALYQVRFASSNPKGVANNCHLYECREEILTAILEKKLTIKEGLVEYQKKGNEIISQDEK